MAIESTGRERIRWAALTCVGLRRDHNEDAVVVGGTVFTDDMAEPVNGTHDDGSPLLLAVADGLGGHAAGERASGMVADGLSRRPDLATGADVEAALVDLNDEIYATMLLEPETLSMGATVAGVLIGVDHLTVFHVGDSRVYLDTTGAFRQVTRDDLVGGFICNCLGGEERSTAIDVHLLEVPRTDVARVVVCSDGLSDLVDLERLSMPAGTPPGDAVTALRELAFDGGAHDNVSIVVAALR